MMDGKFDLFTLLSLVVALIAVFKLRSVLGRGADGEDSRRNERNAARARADASADPSVIAAPRRDEMPAPQGTVALADVEQRIMSFAGGEPRVADALMAIFRVEDAFDPSNFLKGARQAYEMIVTAFAEGNRKTLKDLLAREVFDEFAAEIVAREKRDEMIDQSFVGINKADIVDAGLKGGVATLTVRFVSQLITATRDRAGQVVAGDPQKIREVTDVWTFTRDISSARARQNLNWKLVATQES